MSRQQLETSVLGPTTRVVGRISGEGSLRIEGSVKGDLNVNGSAEIAEGGSIEGNVRAETLDIGGSLLGDGSASGPIAIRSTATVRGELRGGAISIEPGSKVSVRLETEFELDFAGNRERRR